MSPHGMHHARKPDFWGLMTLPTHVSARNASDAPRSLSAYPHLPTHVSARNASTRCMRWQVRSDSQLMSPHGMHRRGFRFACPVYTAPNSCLRTECILSSNNAKSSAGPPNSCLRTECITWGFWERSFTKTPNSCLRTECIFGVFGTKGAARTPNSCLRTECIRADHGRSGSDLLPTHVSARNASRTKYPHRLPTRPPNSCLRTECIFAVYNT